MVRISSLLLEGSNLSRALIGLLVLSGLAVGAYYRRRADRHRGDITASDGPFRVLRLIGLVFAVGLLTYLVVPGWVIWASIAVPWELRLGGAVLSIGSLPLLVWVFQSLEGNVTPTSATRTDHELVTSGPYRWIRHPLYTFAMLFWIGICLVAANWLLMLLLATAFLGVLLRTPLEEQRLIDEFGDDYRAYIEQTGRYWPRVR